MSSLLAFGLGNAVCAALLALAALLAGRFCRRPAVLHSLWLLVLLKLVTPPFWPITVAHLPEEPATGIEAKATPPLSFPGSAWERPSREAPSRILPPLEREAPSQLPLPVTPRDRASQAGRSQAGPGNEERAALPFVGESGFEQPELAPSAPPAVASIPSEKPQGLASCGPLLGLAWLAGGIVWLLWAGRLIVRFHCLLRYARRADANVQQQSDALAARMGLSRPPEIWLLPGPLSPLVWGAFGRVRIFFPTRLFARLDDTERASLLAHELAHVRRRDHWVRWLELITSALYWWYPLVWLARRRLHLHEEECCDAWAIDEVPARTYAGAILNTLDFLAEDRTPLPVMASGLAGVEILKRRLRLIMEGDAPKRLSRSAKVVLVLAGLLLLSLRPNLARTQQKPAPVEETKEPPAAKVEPAAPAEEPTTFNPQPQNLVGGNNHVWSVAFTPDGKQLVVGGGYWDRPGFVSIWDFADRKRLTTLSEPLGVSSVAVSPDGKRLAWGSWSKEARLRDLASGKDITRLAVGGVTRVAFSPDSKLLATAGENKVVKLWDAGTGKEIAELKGDLFRWHCVAFSRDGKLVAAGGGDWNEGGVSQVTLWDVKTHKQVGKLAGHTLPILGVSFSPDNKTIATCGLDRMVKLWDAATFKELATLQGHENWIECVAFSPDGKKLVSSGDDTSVRVWDVAERKLLARLVGHEVSAKSAAFSPDGKWLVSGGDKKIVKIWDAATFQEIAALDRTQTGDLGSPILSMAGSPDGKLFAAGLENQTIQLCDAASGEVLHSLIGHTDAVTCVAFSPDGKTLASGSPDREIRLWDPATGKLRRVLTGHASWIDAVAFSPDSKILASGSYDKTILLWDAETGATRRILKGHRASIRALAFSPDGQTLASAGSDWTIRLWPMNGDDRRDAGPTDEPVVLKGHEDAIRALAFSADGKTLASGSDDQTIKLWDVAKESERATLKGAHNSEVTTLAFSPRGNTLVSGAAGGGIALWDPSTGMHRGNLRGHSPEEVTSVVFLPGCQCILSAGLDRRVKIWLPDAPAEKAQLTVRGHADRAWCATFSPDGRTLATGGGRDNEGALKLWDSTKGKERVTVQTAKPVRFLAYSPDGKTLATGCFDINVQLRDAATGNIVRVLKGHKGGINSLAFSPDGRWVLTGSLDNTAKLWDTATGKDLRTFEGHRDWVLSVAFAPDGKTIATASKDKTVRLWDAAAGKLLRELRGHNNEVEAVTFAPDGKTLATGGWDDFVLLWDAATGRINARLQTAGCGFLSLAFAPDGKTLATGGIRYQPSSGELRLWDVAAARAVRVFEGHPRPIRGVCFKTDGKTLASVSDDGTLKFWSLGSRRRNELRRSLKR